MTKSGELHESQIADIAQCTRSSITRHQVNVRYFDSTTAPRTRRGRRSVLTQSMLDALFERPKEKHNEDEDNLILFL